MGSTVSATVSTTEITYDQLLDMLAANEKDTSNPDYDISLGVTLGEDKGMYGEEFFGSRTEGGDWQNIGGSGISLTNLLTGDTDYILSMLSRQGEELPLLQADQLQQKIVNIISTIF